LNKNSHKVGIVIMRVPQYSHAILAASLLLAPLTTSAPVSTTGLHSRCLGEFCEHLEPLEFSRRAVPVIPKPPPPIHPEPPPKPPPRPPPTDPKPPPPPPPPPEKPPPGTPEKPPPGTPDEPPIAGTVDRSKPAPDDPENELTCPSQKRGIFDLGGSSVQKRCGDKEKSYEDWVTAGDQFVKAQDNAFAAQPRQDQALHPGQIEDNYEEISRGPSSPGHMEDISIMDPDSVKVGWKFSSARKDLGLDPDTKFTQTQLAAKTSVDKRPWDRVVHKAAYSTSGKDGIIVIRDIDKNKDTTAKESKIDWPEMTFRLFGKYHGEGTEGDIRYLIHEDIINTGSQKVMDDAAQKLGKDTKQGLAGQITIPADGTGTAVENEAAKAIAGSPNGRGSFEIASNYANSIGKKITKIHMWVNDANNWPPGLYTMVFEFGP
jgi:hypothetical protein